MRHKSYPIIVGSFFLVGPSQTLVLKGLSFVHSGSPVYWTMKGALSLPSIERYINLSYRVLAALKQTVQEAHLLFDSLYAIVFK